MNNFKELKVWQESIDLSVLLYKQTERMPKEETFGLIAQIRRSSVSISSNIAEGAGRGTKKEFSHFLSIALGSSFELETQLIIAKKIGYALEDEILQKLNYVQNMIFKLKQSLND